VPIRNCAPNRRAPSCSSGSRQLALKYWCVAASSSESCAAYRLRASGPRCSWGWPNSRGFRRRYCHTKDCCSRGWPLRSYSTPNRTVPCYTSSPPVGAELTVPRPVRCARRCLNCPNSSVPRLLAPNCAEPEPEPMPVHATAAACSHGQADRWPGSG